MIERLFAQDLDMVVSRRISEGNAVYRPSHRFGISVVVSIAAIILAVPLLVTHADTGLVPRLPAAILLTSLILTAAVSLTCGMVLDTVTHCRHKTNEQRIYRFRLRDS